MWTLSLYRYFCGRCYIYKAPSVERSRTYVGKHFYLSRVNEKSTSFCGVPRLGNRVCYRGGLGDHSRPFLVPFRPTLAP